MRVILFFASLGAGALLFWFLIAGIGWREVWQPLSEFSLGNILLILLLTGGFIFMGAVRWQSVLKSQGCRVAPFALWKIYLAGFSLLFFTPMFPFASELFRASSLREQHNVDFSKSMASVIVDRILEITSNFVVIVGGGVIFLILGSRASFSAKTIVTIGFIAIWLLLLFFLYVRLFKKQSIVRLFWKGNGRTQEVEREIFRFFHVKNQFFWQGIFLSLIKSLFGIARAAAVVLFFGKGLILLPAVALQGFYYLAILIPIPAAIGSQEALQTVAFRAFGLGVGTGAAFSLVVRTAEILFAALGLVFLFHIGFSFLKKLMFRKEEKFLKLFHE